MTMTFAVDLAGVMPAVREERMNVSCPQCATVFRVDPAKVPERGVRARCSVCGGLIAVRRPALAGPAVPVAPDPVAPPLERPAPIIAAPPVAPPPPPRAVEPPAPPRAAEPAAPPPPPVSPPPVSYSALPPEEPPTPVTPPAIPTGSATTGRFNNPFLQQDPATRARRLARALVSDLVVYHPEKRQRGLADGTLKDLFAEEIRKSWEEYTEQVGEDLARSTPYFSEALNEILAEGRSLFG